MGLLIGTIFFIREISDYLTDLTVIGQNTIYLFLYIAELRIDDTA